MVSVNLFGESTAHVSAKVIGGSENGCPRFITVDIGFLGIILPSAAKAREIALALGMAADQLDAANAEAPIAEPVPVAEIPF